MTPRQNAYSLILEAEAHEAAGRIEAAELAIGDTQRALGVMEGMTRVFWLVLDASKLQTDLTMLTYEEATT
jgi:hypothetical protein